VHRVRQRNGNHLLGVPDAAPISPGEQLLSDDELDTVAPTRTDAFVSHKSVSQFAPR
jgi:hypothetical protein